MALGNSMAFCLLLLPAVYGFWFDFMAGRDAGKQAHTCYSTLGCYSERLYMHITR